MSDKRMDEIAVTTDEFAEEYLEDDIFDETVIEIQVPKISPLRIDKFLSDSLSDYSRTYLKSLVDEGLVNVDGKPIKGSFKVEEGMKINLRIPPLKEAAILPEDIPLQIVYEDEDILFVNKPKNMVVHPAAGHFSGTLVNALMFYLKNELSGINGELRPGIVHRIDKDTTGLLVICKNDVAHRFIAEQLKEHSITRKYVALVEGGFRETEGRIEAPIGRHPSERKKMSIHSKNGKPAVTHYRVLNQYFLRNGKTYSLIECELETGRTHQIRVHMSSIHHPILGDEVYGSSSNPFHLEGQALHAKVLGLIHPTTKKYIEFEAKEPDYFIELLKKLDTMRE